MQPERQNQAEMGGPEGTQAIVNQAAIQAVTEVTMMLRGPNVES